MASDSRARVGLIWAAALAASGIVGALAVRALIVDDPTVLPSAASGVSAIALPASQRHTGAPLTLRIDPQSGPTRVGITQSWRVVVTDEGQAPVRGCRVIFDATMPEHGHGLPTAPRTAETAEAGRYTVEGVRFSMPGYWRIDVAATCGDARSQATFDLRLSP